MMLSRTAAALRRRGGQQHPGGRLPGRPDGPASGVGGRVAGVRVRDLESGREIDVRARTVINAAGVWTDELAR